MSIQDLDEGFNEGLEKLQTTREGFIPAGVYFGEGMSLWRSPKFPVPCSELLW